MTESIETTRCRTLRRMRSLCWALLALPLAAGASLADANLADFPRRAGETDDAPRFRRAIDAAANGILEVPRGEYAIASPLVVTNRCSLEMHPAAHLVATREMDFLLTWAAAGDYVSLTLFEPDGRIYDNLGLFVRGGDIDGNGLASCLRLSNAHHFTLANVTLHNGRRVGLEVSRGEKGYLYELVANNVYAKCNMKGLAGNVGIDIGVSDCHLTDIFVIDYTVGIRVRGSSNRLTRCHVWGGTVPPKGMGVREWSTLYGESKRRPWTPEAEREMLAKGLPEMLAGSIAFDIRGWEHTFDGCYADTAEIGFRVAGGNAILSRCGFYNNPRMGLRKSTAIVHRGGRLLVDSCCFNGGAGCERLYEASGDTTLLWRTNIAQGGADMAAEARKLAENAGPRD